MSLIILAGILNGIAAIFLKLSNKYSFFLWPSLLFFALNFLSFRSGLANIKTSTGYCILISVSLLTLLSFNIITKTIPISSQLILSLILFIGSLFLFLK